MIDNIQPEEKLIREIMGEFGCITWLQGMQFLKFRNKDPETSQLILRNLKKRQYLFEASDGYITINPHVEKDQNMIDAIWVLIHLMQKQVTKLGDFYIARYPAQVDCISNKHQYEIACINQDNTFVITQLLSPQRQTTNKKVEDEPTRFIFVCRDKKSVVEGVKKVPEQFRDGRSVAFALISYPVGSADAELSVPSITPNSCR